MILNLITNGIRVGTTRKTLVTTLAVLALNSVVSARDFRVNMIPNGATFNCTTCHTSSAGGGPRNAFGRDVEQFVTFNGRQQFWSEVFSLDSDGDGFTNGEELGDPDGDGVRTVGVRASNPGSASSKPAVVNKAPTVALTTSATTPFVSNTGTLTLKAAAVDTDGTVQQVEFFVNDVSVGTDTSSPFEKVLELSALGEGNASLKAVAKDNSNATGTSQILTLRVRGPLKMNAPELRQDGSIELSWPSLAGSKFVIEGSDDLSSWTEVTTTTVDGTVGRFSLVPLAQGSKFYRARETE